MARRGYQLLSALVLLATVQCGNDGLENSVYLAGQVYDGATGVRLTDYTMNVVYRDRSINASVNKTTGRFVVGGLPVYQDYTVEVVAANYRTFRSHNGMFNIPNAGTQGATNQDHTTQTFYFDAYLFPAGLVTPDLTLNVRKGSPTGDVASGTARIRPTSQSSLLAANAGQTPAGVGGQLWTNDEDLQAKTILTDFTNGTISIKGTDLIYGVTYLVDIYGVVGYAPLTGTATFTAGVDSQKTFIVSEESSDPLAILTSNASACAKATSTSDTQAAVLTFDFNLDIELATTMVPGGFAESVDNNFTINWPSNSLNTSVSSSVQEAGTSITVNGKTLTFSWNPSVGLNTPMSTTMNSATWDVAAVQVQPVNKPSEKMPLSTLYSTFTMGGSASAIVCSQ